MARNPVLPDHACKQSAALGSEDCDLTSRLFLTFGEDGDLQYQGQIIGGLSCGYFLCQLFSAITGDPTNSIVRHLSLMTDWYFYDDENHWHDAYRNFCRGNRP